MAQPARTRPLRHRSPPKRQSRTLDNRLAILVCVTALAASFSSVAYELLLASYATFLMGASVFQYSLVISLMMASMGVGALFAQARKSNHATWIIGIELSVALCAIVAIPMLYALFAVGGPAQLAVIAFVCVMGAALGMEIPLLNHLGAQNRWLADILFYDYLGGFIGGMLFPLYLLPKLGFFRLAALLAVLNAVVGLGFAWSLPRTSKRTAWIAAGVVCVAASLAAVFWAETIRIRMETHFFGINQ